MAPEAKKTYTVSGPFEVLGHAPGETFEGPLPDWVIEDVLLSSGVLQTKGSAKKIECPACATGGKKKPPSFLTLAELETHYRDKHPALEPPEKEE